MYIYYCKKLHLFLLLISKVTAAKQLEAMFSVISGNFCKLYKASSEHVGAVYASLYINRSSLLLPISYITKAIVVQQYTNQVTIVDGF